MAKQSRYSIEIKDETGKTFTFTADWTVDQRRLAVSQIRRLVDAKRAASATRPQAEAQPFADEYCKPRGRLAHFDRMETWSYHRVASQNALFDCVVPP